MADSTNLVRKKKCKKSKPPESSVWEIAYGDFMTSMMAFFLVMWLVAATNEQQRKIIEYYFTHPMQSVSVSQGSGLNPSKGVFDIGSKQLVVSQVPSENKPITINNQASQIKRYENKYEMQNQMTSILGKIQEAIKSNKEIAPYGVQIKYSINEEGLNIILFDKNDRPMFANGSIKPEPYTIDILKIIASNIRPLPNKIVIEGYANYTPVVSGLYLIGIYLLVEQMKQERYLNLKVLFRSALVVLLAMVIQGLCQEHCPKIRLTGVL